MELYNEGRKLQKNWTLILIVNIIFLEMCFAGNIVYMMYVEIENPLLNFFLAFSVASGFVNSIFNIIKIFHDRKEHSILMQALEKEIKKRGGDINAK